MRANKKTASDSLKEKSRKAFDNQAFSYDTDMRGVHARELYPYVLDEVIKKAIDISSPSLLDLGCGTGALSKMVLDEIPYCTLSCVDYSTEMVKVAKNRLGSKVDVVLGDVESLPFMTVHLILPGAMILFITILIPKKPYFKCGAY